jgi:hypothetical protein
MAAEVCSESKNFPKATDAEANGGTQYPAETGLSTGCGG